MADASKQNKLKSFLDTNKLNESRLLAVSHKLETLTREDRTIKLGKRKGKGDAAEGGDKAEKKEAAKPRSGRPVTPRALDAALKGGEISGPTKQRILRAVNYLLEQKKKDKVELKTLF
jgi:hypothetical protein